MLKGWSYGDMRASRERGESDEVDLKWLQPIVLTTTVASHLYRDQANLAKSCSKRMLLLR